MKYKDYNWSGNLIYCIVYRDIKMMGWYDNTVEIWK